MLTLRAVGAAGPARTTFRLSLRWSGHTAILWSCPQSPRRARKNQPRQPALGEQVRWLAGGIIWRFRLACREAEAFHYGL